LPRPKIFFFFLILHFILFFNAACLEQERRDVMTKLSDEFVELLLFEKKRSEIIFVI
jgi:hypothetical protein